MRRGAAAIAQVEPITTARALRGPFDYLLPEELATAVGVGSMLVVPFGRRKLLGVVVGLRDAARSPTSGCSRRCACWSRRAGRARRAGALLDAREYCSTLARALPSCCRRERRGA